MSGDDRDKAFLMGAVLIRLAEHLRHAAARRGRQPRPGCGTCPCFEEAHRLLRQPQGPGRRARPRTRWRCSPGCWPRSAPTARA